MLTFGCPKCNGMIHAAEAEVGKHTACPTCNASVVVPAGQGSRTGLMVILSLLLVFLIGCPLLILAGLIAIASMGTATSRNFSNTALTMSGS